MHMNSICAQLCWSFAVCDAYAVLKTLLIFQVQSIKGDERHEAGVPWGAVANAIADMQMCTRGTLRWLRIDYCADYDCSTSNDKVNISFDVANILVP
jgi:hypothetical protein